MHLQATLATILFLCTTTLHATPATFRPDNQAKAAVATMTTQQIAGHVKFLSSDLLEGRGTGSRGDQLTQQYIAGQFETLGLQPGAADGSYLQTFDMFNVKTKVPTQITFRSGGKSLAVKHMDDYIADAGIQDKNISLNNAELVFVGYGIVAPEYNWDDYKGADLRGKILLMMNNDPADDPNMFAGKSRLYYGRWTYKFEMAAKMGAAGAFIIHTVPSAGYPFQVLKNSSGNSFILPPDPKVPTMKMQGWLSDEAAKKVVNLSGMNLDVLRAAAEKADFKPVALKTNLSMTLTTETRSTKTANVIGVIPGSDAKLAKQAVIYTAHHDHLGIKENAKPGTDVIFNGALDNATGVSAILTLAKAYMSLPKKPARSVVFMATAAEESHLLGSKYFVHNPTVQIGNIAANINIDGLNIWGPSKDLTFIGRGKSDVDGLIDAIAKMQGRHINSDQFPDRGSYYRADQFSFAKSGIPGIYFKTGTEIIGKPEGWGKQQIEAFEAKDYHQPGDEYRDSWDFSGAVTDLQLMFYLGYTVAQQRAMPMWNKGDEFEAARLKSIADLRK